MPLSIWYTFDCFQFDEESYDHMAVHVQAWVNLLKAIGPRVVAMSDNTPMQSSYIVP